MESTAKPLPESLDDEEALMREMQASGAYVPSSAAPPATPAAAPVVMPRAAPKPPPAPTPKVATPAPAPAPKATSAAPAPAATPAPAANGLAQPHGAMDREFVERNKLVDRYIAGRLPARAAADFERFCRDHPDLLDAIGLADRVNAGLRLLEAGGKPEPWAEKTRAAWDQPHVTIAAGIAAVVLLIATIVLGTQLAERGQRIGELQTAVAEQPLQPATSTRSILLIPARGGPTKRPAVTVGAGQAQFADLKIDLGWSKFTTYRVTIDREDQGRVAVIYNALKDSNGHVRLAFNTSALGPGNYNFTVQGLTWRGEPIPQAWATVAVQR